MARLLFPDEASRLVYRINGADIETAQGAQAIFYTDPAATTPADLREYDGTLTPGDVIPSSALTVGGASLLPLFWGPDEADTLYARVDLGPITAVYARPDARFDRISNARVTTITSSATPAVNTDLYDVVDITALATNVTSFTTGLTGTPQPFAKLLYCIKDTGVSRTLTWGAKFSAFIVPLPTMTVAGKRLLVGFYYDGTSSTWGCVASGSEV